MTRYRLTLGAGGLENVRQEAESLQESLQDSSQTGYLKRRKGATKQQDSSNAGFVKRGHKGAGGLLSRIANLAGKGADKIRIPNGAEMQFLVCLMHPCASQLMYSRTLAPRATMWSLL